MSGTHISERAMEEAETYVSPGRVPLDGRGGWYDEFREDLARYAAHHDGRWLKALLLEQQLWAILHYRISSAVYRRRAGKLSPPVSVALAASQKFVEILTGISLHYKAEVGPGLYLGHFGPLYLSYDARIGAGCNIMHGVTVGVAGRGSRRGVPRIGDRVYIGVYAVVAGDITIGDEAVIGPNAVVTSDVPARTTVVGNPAQVIPGRGTPGMGLHQVPVPARGALRRPADERRLRAL